MCRFISWIEKDSLIYFLTDKEVFSDEGRSKIRASRKDFLGHDAIADFYSLEGNAVRKNVCEFWNLKKLPPQISILLENQKSFMRHWGEMLKNGCFMNDELSWIMENAPIEWKEIFCRQRIIQTDSPDIARFFQTKLHHILKKMDEKKRFET